MRLEPTTVSSQALYHCAPESEYDVAQLRERKSPLFYAQKINPAIRFHFHVLISLSVSLSADSLCKQFRPKSAMTKPQTRSGSKLFDRYSDGSRDFPRPALIVHHKNS